MDNRTEFPAGATRLLEPSEPASKKPAVKPQAITPAPETPKATPSQEITEERVLGHGRPIPTMGLPAMLYELKKLGNADPIPPKLSKKEQQKIEEAERVAIFEQTVADMKELSDQVPTLTVAFVNTKGSGAKTTTWGYTSCFMADLLRSPLTAADFNFASGNGASRLGKDYKETLTLNELRKLIEQNKALNGGKLSFRQLNPKLRRNRYGVAVLSSNDQTLEDNDVYGTSAEVILDNVEELTDYLMIDTGNDITTTVMKRVLEKADIIVFTANVNEPDSLLQLATSMQIVRKMGHAGKVDQSIVAISNLPKGHDVQDYIKYTDRLNHQGQVTERYGFNGAFTAIPHDPHMKKSGIISLEELDPSTQQAYLNLAILILEQGAIVQGFTPKRGTA